MVLGQLFSPQTQAIFFNWKEKPVQRMLDFDYVCGRETPSVAAIVQPGSSGGFQKLFFGKAEIAIPVYGSTAEATRKHPKADVFINYASFRSAYESSLEALKAATIRVVAIIAEGVPEKDTKHLIAFARANNKVIIGPATVGGVQAGAFKIGDTAGTLDNIIACKLHRPGSVGFVSKSGGMSNEMYNVLARATDGLYEGIAIGGDTFPGSTLSDHCLRYEHVPAIKMIVVLGELGGQDEYGLVEAMKAGAITKPVVAWVSGTCAKLFKSEVQFGHAGARSGGDLDSAQAKNAALREAGALVPDSFEGLEEAISSTYQRLVQSGQLVPAKDVTPPPIPQDLAAAVAAGKVRVPTHIVSTICDDRGDEPTYYGVSMSELIEGEYGVGDVISLLWFKRKLPKYATKFIEMCVMMCADHGPCVSGAHNAIVTSRAGKDLVSCLVSGLLTIGPRFGGAIDDAARLFKAACDAGQSPADFVEGLKKKGIRVSGIGHRIKSKDNRDKRVELLQNYARKFFPSTRYLEYAVAVETYTLQKAPNLVLNVDGCIGALFLDLLAASGCFTEAEATQIVEIGYLNALFVVARSIGLVGHALDQKRLQQPLYRHPWEDVLYTS
ncbi:ATP-citrate synthase beta chain protein 1 [Pleodorina starrii]|uniref:ATP citrate synthase n=1 Tax=Pleodorina starrii TaxID=330485 RepID=A0A9W6BTU1_9CHLO|nr:ATP-citrate synthase beta chain protein 1 [Pleodorina starrii]GLC57652.1 ATP-citrate synthase beta chain protein 1 [Pleodorina starrii]GLC63322.1 ATP-citrate synthase beta chain protein 1 [Pleodorina starrii]